MAARGEDGWEPGVSLDGIHELLYREMTKEYGNLFVACRGASFSHIAAVSARLTRTMLSLGEGVGEYIAEQIMAMPCK